MKIRKQIVSPEAKAFGEAVERTRHEQSAAIWKERESNDSLLRPDGGVDVRNAAAQEGRRLHVSELMRRVKKLNPNLWYEQSLRFPEQGGIYVEDTASPYKKRMVASLPHGIVNEFSVPLTRPDVIPDASLAPVWQTIQRVDSKIPGWRTVLLKLAMEGLITPSGIEEQFQITRGRSSQNWQQATAIS